MRAALLILVLLLASCGAGNAPRPEPPRPTATQRACAWLWNQQAADGGWHSDTYGLMRGGQSLTPFVLHALLSVKEDRAERPEGGVARALEFIRTHTDAQGCLGRFDPDISDYPVHATAYAVRCLVAAGTDADKPLIKRMCDWLLHWQYGPARGCQPASMHWGGWGFGSEGGVMDIGHTRHALEALRDAGALDQQAAARAQDFLRLVQRHPDEKRAQPAVPGEPQGEQADSYDGGFYFSPVDLSMNKGRHEARAGKAAWFRSYATATCDGLLSLLAAGVPASDERVVAAAKWLEGHAGLEHPAGIPADTPTPWHYAVHYYHWAVRAEAWAAIGHKGTWQAELKGMLEQAQKADGSFVNDHSPLMKENDPILCTALAIVALARV